MVDWGENDRGVSYTFGEVIVKNFNQKNNIDLICRAHQVQEDGYKFFAGRELVTIFTATNYCDFDNLGVIMKVDKDMVTSFLQIQPDNLIRKAALGKGGEAAGSAVI